MHHEELKAKKYSAIKYRLFFVNLVLTILILAGIQASAVSKALKTLAASWGNAFFAITFLYATLLGIILYIAGLPLSFYKTYVVEHRFGLSNQKLSGWLKDELKSVVIAYIIFVFFAEFLYFALRYYPYNWWIGITILWVIFGIIFAKVFPVLIIPLFFKVGKLEDRDLEDALMRLAQSCGVQIVDIFRLEFSVKTTKANAALAGIGNTRRILLSDTLLENYTKGEIEVVLAHELAHHKFKHMWKYLAVEGSSAVAGFYFINLFLKATLGVKEIYNIEFFPSILLLFTIISFLALPVQNLFYRSMEKAADIFAIKVTGFSGAFISCMNKLAKQNLSDVSPSRFIEIILYNHPPISKRIKSALDFKG